MPTGSISKIKDLIADLVAASAQYQTLVGAANEAAAKTSVYVNQWKVGVLLPFALVEDSPEGSVNGSAKAATGVSIPSGSMMVRIFAALDESAADDGKAQLATFEDNVGTIRDEMLVTAGGSGRIVCRDIRVIACVKTDPDDFENDEIPSALIGVLEVEWGLSQ